LLRCPAMVVVQAAVRQGTRRPARAVCRLVLAAAPRQDAFHEGFRCHEGLMALSRYKAFLIMGLSCGDGALAAGGAEEVIAAIRKSRRTNKPSRLAAISAGSTANSSLKVAVREGLGQRCCRAASGARAWRPCAPDRLATG
jgi:hypothetical protein